MSHSRSRKPSSSSLAEEEWTSLRHHPEYYLSGGDLFFLVTPYHFRVHRYFFERESEYFQRKLAGPASPGEPRRGSSDGTAIILNDVTWDDFAKFLWVFYNPRYGIYDAPLDNWKIILRLAHQWSFPEVKALVLREIEKDGVWMPAIERITLYHDFEVDRNLLIPRYASLCLRDDPLTLEEGTRLGMETTINIYLTRERIHRNSPVDDEDIYNIVREQFKIAEPQSPLDIQPCYESSSIAAPNGNAANNHSFAFPATTPTKATSATAPSARTRPVEDAPTTAANGDATPTVTSPPTGRATAFGVKANEDPKPATATASGEDTPGDDNTSTPLATTGASDGAGGNAKGKGTGQGTEQGEGSTGPSVEAGGGDSASRPDTPVDGAWSGAGNKKRKGRR